MTTVTVTASSNYNIQIGPGVRNTLADEIKKLGKVKTVCIVSDSNVYPLYGEECKGRLEAGGFRVCTHVFPAGENSKNGYTYLFLLNCLAENKLTRSDLIVALGGGVVGDLAGFAAATYLRGIRFVQIPTTLLAAVDSSVGGKTAIDLTAGKNLAGAFYQPSLVLCDTETLDTLPNEVFLDGCAEVIKYGILYDPELFAQLEASGPAFDREAVITRCVQWKRDVVAEDEFDTGARMKLNLGHTIGHGIEACSDYRITHGNAVSAGMAIVARASRCSDTGRILKILRQFHLPVSTDYSAQQLYEHTLSDKKRSGGTLNLIIPRSIGSCEIVATPVEKLKSFIEAGLAVDITLNPRKLRGEVAAIPSKSQAHRLLICAAFAKNPTYLICPETNQDIEATAQCLNQICHAVQRTSNGYDISPYGYEEEPFDTFYLNCHESGSTLRFLLPVMGALGSPTVFKMEGRLPRRPLSPLWEEMERMGCSLHWVSEDELLLEGKLRPGDYHIRGDVSSQFISGLLFAAALMEGDSTITIEGTLESAPYVAMTQKALALFGVDTDGFHVKGGQKLHSPETVTVEGDWSNGAFWLAAKALGNDLTINDLDPDSPQGDRAAAQLISALKEHQILDASDIPDLVPVLSVVAACHQGAVFTGIRRLRLKESDRVASVIAMLQALGGMAEATEDALTVHGTGLTGGTVDAVNDHRIAMSAAIASTVCKDDVAILGADCVKKSYPKFWEEFSRLGGKYEFNLR